MVSVDALSVSYGGFTLLDNVSFHISDNDRIGLVGKNGAGKSTLMKLICSLQKPTSGRIDLPPSVSVGYLPQIMEHHKGRSVLEETLLAFDRSKELERESERVTAELESREDYDSASYLALAERLSDIQDSLAALHSEPPEVQARKALLGLGFREEELSHRTETFSQGWNMRIELAKILLQNPSLLLLDEPTNHLDLESIEWLEDFLKGRRGALMVVSHDRRFLDTVTTRTIEIVLGHIYDYKVPYSQFTVLRQERMAQQTAAYENQQRMIQKSEEFIAKFRYKPTKSNQVQSRMKALQKLNRIEIDETDNAQLVVKFPPAPRSGDIVYKAVGLSAGYPAQGGVPAKVVFSGADIEIRRAEKVALVGRNGEGKTTFIRTLLGQLPRLAGESGLGYNVDIGYYAQNQEDVLDKSLTVFETLDKVAVGEVRTRLRDILAQFLFRGEDIDKKVSVLSGGERARLSLARLMLERDNLLVLDEPTNHMDIRSKDILKQALNSYDGAMVIVSHDRDFLEGLCDKFYEFDRGKVREHLESLSDFLEKHKIETLRELDRIGKGPEEPAVKAVPQKDAPKKTASYETQKLLSKQERRRRDRIKYLESQIDKNESRMKEIEGILSAPSKDDDIMELTREYLNLKRDTDALEEEWGTYL